MKIDLAQNIQVAYDKLITSVQRVPFTKRADRSIAGSGGQVSIVDLIAYQIGWGQCLISWYTAGINSEQPVMPGDGFTKWEYAKIAQSFYQKYAYDGAVQQLAVFATVVVQIIAIATEEQKRGKLDQLGVWSWCTLATGKQWPLSKWIQVNTVAPYRRAAQLIKAAGLI